MVVVYQREPVIVAGDLIRFESLPPPVIFGLLVVRGFLVGAWKREEIWSVCWRVLGTENGGDGYHGAVGYGVVG